MSETTSMVTLDRIERDARGCNVAVLILDDGEQLTVPLERLPEGTREGAVLTITLRLDVAETRNQRKRVRDLQSRLFRSPESPDERTP